MTRNVLIHLKTIHLAEKQTPCQGWTPQTCSIIVALMEMEICP